MQAGQQGAHERVARADGVDHVDPQTRTSHLTRAAPDREGAVAAARDDHERRSARDPVRRDVGQRAAGGQPREVLTYRDPATGLEVRCEATLFNDYPAVEWVLHFTNTGSADTPQLTQILPLAVQANVPEAAVTLHHSPGSDAVPGDFLPQESAVPPGARIELAPNRGRSSDGALPFFNLEWGDGGVVGAIGWSGQWVLRVQRDAEQQITLEAGQQTANLLLHPGETVRTPRILLVSWQGADRMRGHNLLRRLLLDHYTPRRNGQPVLPPVAQLTWFTFASGNDVTEQNQLDVMQPMPGLGVEAYWMDAGWFEGGWPQGAGSWVPKPEAFPRGLKPVGDEAHRLGMKFVLWFEPERVHPGSRIAREHPDWVLWPTPGAQEYAWLQGDGLFNLGDPTARAWLTDYLSQCLTDWGVDVFRNDFNIDPLRFWQAHDSPDRQGLSEIRYIEGLYAMWDELLRRHPGLTIDNCSSGGRRIDLETISRSYPLWRSDLFGNTTADQVMTSGLSLYVPLHAGSLWGFDPYVFRSQATTGCAIAIDTRGKDFPVEQARKMVDQAKSLRELWLGDFYALLDINLSESSWCAWQCDRPELGKGFALFFRRSQSPYAVVEVSLRGLDAQATYEVTNLDTGAQTQVTGAELAGKYRAEVGQTSGSTLLTYRKLEP